jgi:serine/threonine-protein kinase HipA
MTAQTSDFARALDVYWDKALAGRLMQNAAGSLSFAYDPDFLQTAQAGISISLPPQEGVFVGDVVKAFFSGLLPEESVRMRLAQYLGVSDKNAFALLQAVGGECAGALALYPAGESPAPVDVNDFETLDDARLAEILAMIKRRPFLVGDDLRISLAGAQDKLAVGFENKHVLLMTGGQPTTHILKPIIDRVTDSAHNELFCMRLAKMAGLDVPFADIHFVNDTPYYIVERYDRVRQADGSIAHIHQEDFCQALGILPELKYEREGGPSIAKCRQVILDHAARPAADQIKFLEIVIFNYLIGNADAHGKNFSLLYRGHKPELAPAYDLLSTAIYPDLSSKMAMKIGGKYEPDDVFLRHWHRLIPDTKAAQSAMNKQLKTITESTIENALVLKETLEAKGLRSPVFADICQVIEDRAKGVINQVTD